LQNNVNRAAELSSKVRPREYTIDFSLFKEKFSIIDSLQALPSSCSLIKSKIVIIGYLGPRDEDMYQVTGATKAVYGTIILSHVIQIF
jgi:hypothetical protein